jgi:hypothetical protein
MLRGILLKGGCMSAVPNGFCRLGMLAVALVLGCGSPEPIKLTPEQIEKQKAENKVNLDAEDEIEAKFQKERKGN